MKPLVQTVRARDDDYLVTALETMQHQATEDFKSSKDTIKSSFEQLPLSEEVSVPSLERLEASQGTSPVMYLILKGYISQTLIFLYIFFVTVYSKSETCDFQTF